VQRHKAWIPEALGFFRTFTSSPYAKEINEIADLEKSFLQIIPGWHTSVPRFEQRANSVTAVLRDSGIKQVLELGAGYTDRGLVMTEDPDLAYIETDLRPWIEQKERCVSTLLARRGEDRPNLGFAEANALRCQDLLAAASGLSGPVAIVTEGLLSYQYAHKRYQIALNVRHLLEMKGGVWITPDLMTRSEREKSYVRAALDYESQSGCSSRRCFEDEEEREDFVRDVGFTIEAWYQSHLAGELGSLAKVTLTAMERRDISKTLEDMRVYCLRPIRRGTP
jgi:O-methyltransferase involved in polyketide biosynthesis